MKFGYTILYVQDVVSSIAYYEKVFGLNRKFVHESGAYAELETGGTTLSFASFEVAKMHNLKLNENSATGSAPVEIVLVTPEVKSAYEKALSLGAIPIKAPEAMPWGQVVAYVQDLNGYYVELASPIGE